MTEDIGLDPWATVWRENYHAMMSLTFRVWSMLEHSDVSSLPEWMKRQMLTDVLDSGLLHGPTFERAQATLDRMQAQHNEERERLTALADEARARITMSGA